MDRHHQAIIGYLNELIEYYQSIHVSSSRQKALSILPKLHQYADIHLKSEEALLAQVGFSNLESHTKIHDQYKDLVISFYQQEMDVEKLHSLIKGLRTWWDDHILKQDMAYRPFVEGVDLEPNLMPLTLNEEDNRENEVDEELMEIFRDSTVANKDKLTAALSDKDWSEVRATAHTIKGSAASFGFPELSNVAARLQSVLDKEQVGQASELTMNLLLEMDKVLR